MDRGWGAAQTRFGAKRRTRRRQGIRQHIRALQLIFLFFLQENELRKALIPFIGVWAVRVVITVIVSVGDLEGPIGGIQPVGRNEE